MSTPGPLGLDPTLLNACVQCGLCLPHCPTFRVTGDEAFSPRGRIRLMREVEAGNLTVDDKVERAFDTCVQCRGCEPACPSGVQYGRLIEVTRAALIERRRWRRFGLRAALAPLTRPRLLVAGVRMLSVMRRAHLVPAGLPLPGHVPWRRRPLRTSGSDVYLFTGCVMDVVQRDVHLDAQAVLEAAGFGVLPTGADAPCCGALHAHAGLADRAARIGADVVRALDRDIPILVDSAGCGAWMKELGHHLATPDAIDLSARVYDLFEFLESHRDRLPVAPRLDLRVAVQDPCHLRHVQRAENSTRVVLRPYVRELVDTDDAGLCCGAGGAYSVFQPALAGKMRRRKVAAIERAAADLVVSANPGCSMFLGDAGVDAVHPVQLLARALNAEAAAASKVRSIGNDTKVQGAL